MKTPYEIKIECCEIGVAKTEKSLRSKLILGFIGGAMISLGYLAYIKIAASFTGQLAGLGSFIGACVFPVGLIIILLAGGELVTGNMMAVSAGLLDQKISLWNWLKNLLMITCANIIGAVFVALVFGHIVGITQNAEVAHKVNLLTQAKLNASFLQAFCSGIGCNWFVGLALWLCYGAKDSVGKILGIWFPVMTFAVIGFQHSIANVFLISAAIFEGQATWLQFISNFIPVYLGNIVGGLVFVALFYHWAYPDKKNPLSNFFN